ncbi:FMN-binding domain-containing protein [Anaerovirgula multivorans]|uniref:FMN-binding domain-containing protein n=1 Tax=Anaerovirgula multivorans TaxID=312168 RepID=A0A239HBX5_9FIRM|nr:FMN-binding protein [Anaerovirgula multivorans]SNS78899.1 FMN-binding domain-containing protein [Anaerovirgula multivorans]
MTKQQKIAAILLPLLALAILFGGDMVFGGPESAFYEGAAEGYAGEIRVRVEVAAGEILSIEILEINDTPGLGDKAAGTITDSIIEAQSTEVDVVSGATMSSLGTINAVEAALAQAPATYPDGTHEGVGQGYNGDIKVKVNVSNGAIQSIEVVEINDTQGLGDAAADTIAERIVEAQSTEVDVVTNATMSSRGMIQAVRDALGL